jgi:putative transposase
MRPTSSETTYSPSLLSSWLATTKGGLPQIASDAGTPPPAKKAKAKKNPDKASAAKARKIRVYPNPRQRDLLQKWFGTARWTYNKCLALIKEDRSKRSKKELRATLVNNENFVLKDTWVTEVPYEVRDGAMVDLINAYTSNFAKKRKNNDHHFEMQFRAKKAPQEAIMIRGKCFKKGVFYPKFFGKERLRSSEPLPDLVDYDCKLIHTRLGHYYLCLPMPLEMVSDNQARLEDRVVALDPGVRTFHTAYDPSGSVMEFGKGDIGHIYRLCSHMDKLQSHASDKTLKHHKRYALQKATRKMQWRIRNLIDECHKKMVKFLVANYSVILLPAFETQQMVVRNQRKISSRTARAMITWSHYRFKQRLLFKRQEHPWCKVVVCDEAYTSKTCGQCGQLHHALGASKVFACPHCKVRIDRDVNAARNILLKNASLFGFTLKETLGLTPS